MFKPLFLISSLFLLASANLAAADFKVATVDINRVLNECREAVTKRADIDKKSAEVRKRFEDRGKKLKETEGKLRAANVAADSKEAEQFKNEARDFTRQVKDAEDDLKDEVMKFQKVLTERALKLISDYAKAQQLDLVLDKGDRGGGGPVLYGVAPLDITEEMIKRMDQK